MNIRKIIAREGLVIITLCILAAAAYGIAEKGWGLDDWEEVPQSAIDAAKKDEVATRELIARLQSKSKAQGLTPEEMTALQQNIEQIEMLSVRITPTIPILNKIRFRPIAFFFLFLAYPIYLLGRFIIWAIKTLREKKANDASPCDDEFLSRVVFLFAIALLICGTITVFSGKPIGIVTSVYGVAVLCLIFSRLHNFEWFEGFGVKAQLKKKIVEADQTIERVKRIALPLAEQLLTNSARAGRWGTMVKRRERYRLEENIVTGLRDLGFSNKQIDGARKDCHEMNIFDLAMPIWKEIEKTIKVKSDHLRGEMSKIKQPIAGEGHARHHELHQQLIELGKQQESLKSLAYQERKESLAAQYVDFVDGSKLYTADEKGEILLKLKEELEDLKYYLEKKEFRRPNVWFLHDDVQSE